MYTGLQDLESGLYQGLAAFHDALRNVLPKAPEKRARNGSTSQTYVKRDDAKKTGATKQSQNSGKKKKKSNQQKGVRASAVRVDDLINGPLATGKSPDPTPVVLGATAEVGQISSENRHGSNNDMAPRRDSNTNNGKTKNNKKKKNRKNNKKKK